MFQWDRVLHILMKFHPKMWLLTPSHLNESAGARQSNEVPPAVQLTVKESLSQIGLANSASQLIGWHPTANTWWPAQANGNPNKIILKIYTVYRFWELLTDMWPFGELLYINTHKLGLMSTPFLWDLHLYQQDPLDFRRCPMEQYRWCRSSLLIWRRGPLMHPPRAESPLCVRLKDEEKMFSHNQLTA